MKIKALYIQHVGLLGGSGRSLYEMISALPADKVDPHLICQRGPLKGIFEKTNIPVLVCSGLTNFNNNNYGYYHSWRWAILIRELILILPTISVLIRARLKWGKFDIIHINEITMPLVVLFCKLIFFSTPIVVHARAIQRNYINWRARFIKFLLKIFVQKIIAINQSVKASFPFKLKNIEVIHNGMVPPKGPEKKHSDRKDKVVVGMVGLINRAKGCIEFVEAANLCEQRNLKIEYKLFGKVGDFRNGVIFKLLNFLKLQENITKELQEYIKRHGLEKKIELCPFESNLAKIYKELDIVCFPSRDPAPGRPIFEAGFFGVPAIASINDPRPDTFIPGQTGILVSPRNPNELAKAISMLCLSSELRKQMGSNAFKLSHKNFNAISNSEKVYKLYLDILRN